jgi:hypothetical protein
MTTSRRTGCRDDGMAVGGSRDGGLRRRAVRQASGTGDGDLPSGEDLGEIARDDQIESVGVALEQR